MNILNAEQTRLADAYTIEHEPIADIDLMERASTSFVEAFYKDHTPKVAIVVVCGTGNNGGDGLAISRILVNRGYDVKPFVVRTIEGGSPNFKVNFDRLNPQATIKTISDNKSIPDFGKFNIIIDALFGSGLTRVVTDLYGDVIRAINDAANTDVISVDIPSGLFVDKPVDPQNQGAIIKAKTTISFQTPKLSFFIPENHQYVGQWIVVDIGLDNEFINMQDSGFCTIEHSDVEKILPERNKFAHKGTFGHGQLFGGSTGKMGAITLAAEAFLRTGAGLLTVTVPSSGVKIMQTSVPEAMALEQPGKRHISSFTVSPLAGTFGIGPGLGKDEITAKAFRNFLEANKNPLVLDADALNILSEHPESISFLPEDTIITPHIKEFDRLAGPSENSWQRLEKAREFSLQWKIITVLKGAHTAVINKDGKIYFNTTGNPGMATGGSGDVLLGIITSLRTQGLSAIDATIAGVYIHGLAGDIAAETKSMTATLARDIIEALSEVFLKFSR
ncbi:MAG: bifunctional ADP-dependent NAD(P)H-hydrate dehydratase/NAD(P)H-hydrate epimerase [Bacteroidetes bacterium]|nr:MAG: bifunctional ADP-dependent NAD(P)H-hydrate dehydratase/NAD(P)H-hydrate epimerase [Bacteroidota bacterium]